MIDLIAAMAKEPYYLSPSEVGRLSVRQIEMLVERIEGNPAPPDTGPTPQEDFWRWGRMNKLSDYQIKALWDERQAERAE